MADEQINLNARFFSLPADTSGATFVQGRWVTDVGVQWGMNDVTLLFFESKIPLSPFSEPEQSQAFFEEMAYRPAECVGRMILSVDRAELLFNLLRQALRDAHASKQRQFFNQLQDFLTSNGVADEFEELLRTQRERQSSLSNNEEEYHNGS